ncbi:MAG: Re/Si-specific NAD(P)(+) transhydrogenase subunit alpha [Gammaproteobacteria bacterium]|nr:Re/Si-specific NAD(P)(+) transhydrogenase subunit alpha [Gammaproteobacteria bacterium]
MKIGIPKEIRPGENRVAISPETIKKLAGMGVEVVVEAGCGTGSCVTDQEYQEAGASVAPDAAATLGDADLVFKIQRPMTVEEGTDEIALMKEGAILVGHLATLSNPNASPSYNARNLTTFAMDLMPRISRAQSMDVLSSQSNLAGYKAVVDAATEHVSAFPMMMTAAGTVAPARVFIMGVGVAGLQAIATAKRLGAVVTAYDVRPATREQVESLGGKFLIVDEEAMKDAETAGGYAKEMTEEYKQKERQVLADHVRDQDIVITTALIPGRPAPVLVTREMVESMKPGSVIVDLAVETGGNCECAERGIVAEHQGVRIIGYDNMPARLARDASNLFAKNILNFLTPHIDAENGALNLDWEDETIAETVVTRDGEVVNARIKELMS